MRVRLFQNGALHEVQGSQQEIESCAKAVEAVGALRQRIEEILGRNQQAETYVPLAKTRLGQSEERLNRVKNVTISPERTRTFYIAGPITGREENVYKEHFQDAFKKLVYKGEGNWTVLSPVSTPDHTAHDKTWESYMRACLPYLCMATDIYLLKGFHLSAGASIELWLAIQLGIDIEFEEEMDIPTSQSLIKASMELASSQLEKKASLIFLV